MENEDNFQKVLDFLVVCFFITIVILIAFKVISQIMNEISTMNIVFIVLALIGIFVIMAYVVFNTLVQIQIERDK
jgi:hypothetical protein